MDARASGSDPAVPPAGARPITPYLDALGAVLVRARTANASSLAAAARVIETTVTRDGIVYVFGSGHSQLVALELNRRAGGLAPVQVIFDPTWGAAERLEGYAETLVAGLTPSGADCLVVISHSGVTAVPVAMARWGRSNALPVIAVTSIVASPAATTGSPSGRHLCEVADVVLDNGAIGADASVHVPGFDIGLGPTSTVIAEALLHEVVVGAIAALVARGLEAPVLRPNAERDGRAHNALVLDRYRSRLQRVP